MLMLSTKKGFTLVETMVVVVLVGLLAGAGYTFFFVFTKEKSETAAYLKTQAKSETLIDYMGRGIRSSSFISPLGKLDSRSEGQKFAYSNTLYRDTVFFYSTDATDLAKNPPVGGLRVWNRKGNTSCSVNNPCVVEEWVPANQTSATTVNGEFRPMTVARGDTIFVNRDNQKAFTLVPKDKDEYLAQLEVDMTVKSKYNSNKDSVMLKLERGVFKCRI
jgi:prepilin-type N-terminal cleavage/methylation domain-containing protein